MVDVEHISTNEFIAIYTYWNGRLRRAGTVPGYSAHPGLWAGMSCSARGSRHFITVHQFVLGPATQPRYRTEQDTVYAWQGPELKLRTMARRPPIALLGYRLPSLARTGVAVGRSPAHSPNGR